MAGRFQSVWMDLLLVSITIMMLQPQEVSTNGKELEKKVLAECQKILSDNEAPNRKTICCIPLPTPRDKRCKNFWDKFRSAFVKKDPLKVGPEAYSDLIKAEPIVVEKDKLLLWSKTAKTITWLSEQNEPHFFFISKTIYNILNDKTWCGATSSKDVLTDRCPDYSTPVNPVKSYWRSVSAALAKAAQGIVTVLLNGSIQKPYDSQSIFATDELPNLGEKVTALNVLLVQNALDDKICDNDSLKELQKSWGKRTYQCKYIQQSQLETTTPAKWWETAKISRRNSIH